MQITVPTLHLYGLTSGMERGGSDKLLKQEWKWQFELDVFHTLLYWSWFTGNISYPNQNKHHILCFFVFILSLTLNIRHFLDRQVGLDPNLWYFEYLNVKPLCEFIDESTIYLSSGVLELCPNEYEACDVCVLLSDILFLFYFALGKDLGQVSSCYFPPPPCQELWSLQWKL